MAGGVDKGGINYGIDVQYPSASGAALAQFRADIAAAKLAYEEFKAITATSAAASAATVASTKAQAAATAAAAKATGVRAIAEKSYAAEVLRSAVAREKGVIADERTYALDKKILSAKQLRRKAEQDVSDVVNKRNIILARAQALQERGIALDTDELVKLGLAVRLKKAAKKPVDDLTKSTEALAKAKAKLANATQLENLAQIKATNFQIRNQVNARANQLAPGAGGSTPNLKPLKKDLDEANTSSNLLWNSLKRVLFIAVAFKTANLLASTIRDAIAEAINFNSQMKQAEVGIAALISSAADVRDEFGNAAADQKRFVISLMEARRQTRGLQKDALLTNATFEDLVVAFQQGVAPGLEAGLNLDQIRNFTRQISAAAQAIGLPQAQLAEEIRSILGGTITARQTRIATALGITNADIKNAKETGTLADFLAKKFKAFDLIADNSGDIVDILAKKIKTAIGLLLGTGGQGFVDHLAKLLQNVLNQIVTINKTTGDITFNPKLLSAVEILGTGLSYVADKASELTTSLLADSNVEGFAQKVANGIKTATEVVIGFVQGLGDAVRILSEMAGIVLPTDAFSPEKIRGTVREITKFTAVFLSLKVVADQVSGLLKGIGPLLGPIGSFLGFLSRVAIPAIVAGFSGIAAALGATAISIGAIEIPLIAVLAVVVALAAAIYFVSRNFERITVYAQKFDLAIGDALVSLGILPKEMSKAFSALGKVADFQLSQTKTFGQTLTEDWNSLTSFLTTDAGKTGEDMARKLQEGFDKKTSPEQGPQGFVLTLSQALEDAKKEIEDLQKKNKDAMLSIALDFLTVSDAFSAAKEGFLKNANVLGAGGNEFFGNSSIIAASTKFLKDRVDAEIKVKELNKDLVKEQTAINDLKKQQAVLESIPLANERERLMMEEDLDKLNAKMVAHLDRQRSLQIAKNQLLEENTVLARLELDLATRKTLEDLKSEAIAIRARGLRLVGREDSARAEELGLEVTLRHNQFLVEQARVLDNIAQLEAQRATFKNANDTDPTIIDAQIAKQRELLDVLREQEKVRAAIFTEELRRANLRASSNEADIPQQITLALRQMEEQLPNQFARVQIVVTSVVDHLTDFISNGIVDAFDPTKKVDLRQRFGLFLQGIATDIIQMLARIAAVKLALGLVGIFGATDGGTVPQGFQKGGRVNQGKRAESHRHIRGYAAGGSILPFPRPSYISPKDTVPAWLQPGEHVQPVSAVRIYGEDLMESLRAGLADPYAVRAAAGLNAARTSLATGRRAPGPMGYAAGGSVAPASPMTSTASPSVIPAVLLADDTTAETILSQGAVGAKNLLDQWGYQRR